MFEKVAPHPELVAGEHATLRLWDEGGFFEALRRKNSGRARWSFLDGPITANNPMGVHHAWGRTYKDVFQRYFAMRGFDQRFQNGFDCQGLWVEVLVERELGFDSKKDIEEFGLEKFVNACKTRVLKYAEIQTQQSIRLGQWMDWDNSYYTMSDENNYTIWSFLKRCHDRGVIYKGMDSMPWCPRCGTGISEQERREGYREVEDESVYLKFPLRGRAGEYLLVWTTTPWTLAANVAAAVHPSRTYVRVLEAGDFLYLSKSRLSVVGSRAEVTSEVAGSDMVGWEYEGPFDEFPAAAEAARAHRVIAWDEVSDDEGTGIVHIAPGCGREDYQLGLSENLPVIAPIDEAGTYYAGFESLSGKYAPDVAPEVYDSLESKGLFYKSERYLHDYPHCWRCNTPLLFRAVDEWYIGMNWRDEIADVAKRIRWIPAFGLDQELDWLRNMGDWMISKKRYWGLALPIWECSDCGWFDVIGGQDELRDRAVQGWEQFEGNTPHRPWIDAVKIRCESCGSHASRVPDVGNPWLDAGIVPYSTVGYNQDRTHWKAWVPADFVVESFPGQFRNWFYALLAMSTMLEGIPPFKTLLGYALMRDEEGREMHKSWGNLIEINEAADAVGADVMRWLFCRHTPTANLNFGFEACKQIERKVFGTLWNTYLFFVNYAILDGFDPVTTPVIPPSQRPEIDRWVLSSLQRLAETARAQLEQFWLPPFVRAAEEFIDDLSNWYVRRSRQRFWSKRGEDEHSKDSAYQTLYEVLTTLVRLLAPLLPFLTERMYQNLVAGSEPQTPPSVHLSDYPEPEASLIDEKLEQQMRFILDVTAAGHRLREQAGHRVRQPLARLMVAVTTDLGRESLARLSHHVAQELNVKEVEVVEDLASTTALRASPNFASLGPRFGADAANIGNWIKDAPQDVVRRMHAGDPVVAYVAGTGFELVAGDFTVHSETAAGWVAAEAPGAMLALDTRLDPQLEREGLARDVVRHFQNLRRDTGLNIEDRIELTYATGDATLAQAIDEWRDYISAETQCHSLSLGDVPTGSELDIGGRRLKVTLRRR